MDSRRILLFFAGAPSVAYDSDSQTYFDAVAAAGTTLSDTQKNAFNTFVTSCKSANVWSKLYALYPYMGATAAAHAINAKNPGSYDLIWNGTLIHSAAGVKGDGSTGYGNTTFTANVFSSAYNVMLATYINSPDLPTGYTVSIDLGVKDGSGDLFMMMTAAESTDLKYAKYTVGAVPGGANPSGNANCKVAVTTGVGCLIGSATTANGAYLMKNGSVIATQSTNYTDTLPGTGRTIKVRAMGATTAGNFSPRNAAMDAMGYGLTTTEAESFSTAINTLQTALGRNA